MSDKKESTGESQVPALNVNALTTQDVPALLKRVGAQISALKGNIPNAAKDLGVFEGIGKLQDMKTVEVLLKVLSILRAKESAYKTAVTEAQVELKKYPFKINKHSASVWATAITYRIGIVKNEVELKKLEKVQKILKDNLSAEAKFANDMKSATAILFE